MRALLVPLLLVACAHSPPTVLICPANGGPAWTELTSEHFQLRTDLPLEEARRVIADLEQSQARIAIILDQLLRPGPQPRTTDVLLFAREKDLRETTDNIAVFRNSGDRREPLILLSNINERHETIVHELVHRFLHRRIRRIPVWLNEGLADYLSSMTMSDGELATGAIPSTRAAERKWLPNATMPDVLAGAGALEFYDPRWVYTSYESAWALVHSLATQRLDRLRVYLQEISDGTSDDDAFRKAFGPPKDLAPGLRTYLSQLADGVAPVLHFPEDRPAPEIAPRERPMSETEIHMMWFHLTGSSSQLEDAAAHGGDSPEVHMRRARLAEAHGDQIVSEEELARAIALAPAEPRWRHERTHVRFSRALGEPDRSGSLRSLGPEMATMVRETTDWHMMNEAAYYYAKTRQPSLGLPLARRAMELAPESWALLDTLALLLFEDGKLAEALAAQEEAVVRASEDSAAPAEMIERLRMYRANVKH